MCTCFPLVQKVGCIHLYFEYITRESSDSLIEHFFFFYKQEAPNYWAIIVQFLSPSTVIISKHLYEYNLLCANLCHPEIHVEMPNPLYFRMWLYLQTVFKEGMRKAVQMGPLPNLPSGLFVEDIWTHRLTRVQAQSKEHVRTQREDGHLHPKQRGARRDQTWHHSDCGLEASKTEKINLCDLSHSAFVMAALAN